ncbi:MAG: CHAT domain-containing protein, partial [Cyanobacteria bacterium P01_H01_bin.121]
MTCAIVITAPILVQVPVQAQTNPVVLVEQGQQQFRGGQYSDAVASLEQAIAAFEAENQALQQAITLSNLALVHQASSDWGAAEDALQRCFALLGVAPHAIATAFLPTLSTEQFHILASALNVYGKGLLQKGDPDLALEAWQQAEQAFTAVGDREGQLTSQINQLQALQSLGRFQQADALADDIKAIIDIQPNRIIKAKGLLNLGNIERAIGHLRESQATLEAGLAIAVEPELFSTFQLSLGTTQHALGNRDKERLVSINRQGTPPWVCSLEDLPDTVDPQHYATALEHYKTAAAYAPNQVAADLNSLAVFQARNELDTAAALQTWYSVEQQLPAMGQSRAQVYAHIALAKQGACLNQSHQRMRDHGETSPPASTEDAIPQKTIQALVETAIAISQKLQDPVATSYALGNLGGWYEALAMLDRQAEDNALSEQTKSSESDLTWYEKARELTEQALFLAQPSDFPDIAFQWQWQLGRLDEVEGKEEEAIVHYKQAAKTLESVRGNLLTIDSDVQFSFRDNVEPLYRELVDLLLRREALSPGGLKEAIQFIDTLQLAELENFLQCSLSTARLDEDVIDQSAATLYGVVLKDRVEMILRLPDESLQNYKLFVAQEDFEKVLTNFQVDLKRPSGVGQARKTAGVLYQQLIQPLETALDADGSIEESEIKTLTLILDGSLRSLPFSVLHDDERNRYLVERYSTVFVPSLNLVEPEPLSRNINLFTGGISQSVKHPFREGDFTALTNVEREIEILQEIFPGDILFNEALNQDQLTKKLTQKSFPIVHLATH